MMFYRSYIVTALVSLVSVSGYAQLPEEGGALNVFRLPLVTVGIRAEDSSRRVKDGSTDIALEMPRVVVAAQFPLSPGISPWLEAGWHEPNLASGTDARGGFTWGVGVSLRPWLFAIREDPEIGPRDWMAVKLDGSLRGGSADQADGEVDWTLFEAKIGMEWHKKIFGSRPGPMDATAMTAGAGLVLNSLQAEKSGFDGSESNAAGVYVHTTFTFGPATFFGLEADWYGSSDRKLALISGIKF
jgi:hypothetical protein